MVVLFKLSSQTRGESSDLSGGITKDIISFFYKDFLFLPEETRLNLLSTIHVIVRKMAHFSAFFFMGLFSSLAMLTYSCKLKTKILVPLIIGLSYGIFDEVHQALVPGRGPGVLDVLLDFFGCLCGTVCVFLALKFYERRKSNE